MKKKVVLDAEPEAGDPASVPVHPGRPATDRPGQLAVSRGTIDTDLDDLTNWLSRYGLTLRRSTPS